MEMVVEPMTGSDPATTPTPLPETAFLEASGPPRPHRRRLLIVMLVVAGMIGGLCVATCLVISATTEAQRLTSPADVLRIANEIVPITIPPGYAGELAEVVQMPLFTVRKVLFRHESGKGTLSIVEIKMPIDLKEQEAEVQQAAFDSFVTDMRQLAATDESQRTITIHGQPAEFQLRAGRDALSSTQLHEVRGVFAGSGGQAQLWLQAEDSIWDEKSVEQMLESLADEGT